MENINQNFPNFRDGTVIEKPESHDVAVFVIDTVLN
jgi:hypothetical protein